MQTLLTMLRHKDGRLGVFHGGLESDLHRRLMRLSVNPASPSVSPRKAAISASMRGKAACWLMSATAARRPFHRRPCAPLAFEMSHGGDRLIVNCGPNLVHGTDWQLAARGLAAHSTLAFDADVTDPFLRHGMAAKRLWPAR